MISRPLTSSNILWFVEEKLLCHSLLAQTLPCPQPRLNGPLTLEECRTGKKMLAVTPERQAETSSLARETNEKTNRSNNESRLTSLGLPAHFFVKWAWIRALTGRLTCCARALLGRNTWPQMGVLKQHQLLIWQFCRSEVWPGLTGLKSRCAQAVFL